MINIKKIFDYLFPTLSLLYVLFQTLNTMWYAIKLMKKKKNTSRKELTPGNLSLLTVLSFINNFQKRRKFFKMLLTFVIHKNKLHKYSRVPNNFVGCREGLCSNIGKMDRDFNK